MDLRGHVSKQAGTWHLVELTQRGFIMTVNRPSLWNALIVFGGLLSVGVVIGLFACFPMYQLLDRRIVCRPIWDPPRVVVRQALQGFTAEALAQSEKDPRQKELVDQLRQPLVFEPRPSWLGHPQVEPGKSVSGRRYPSNSLLYLAIGAVILYVVCLKRQGIL